MASSSKADMGNGEVEAVGEEVFEEMKSIQQQFEQMELELAKQRVKLSAPAYERRRKVFEKIPKFWTTVFMKHPVIVHWLDYDDSEVIQNLKELIIEKDEQNLENYKIILTFNKNSYFSNTELTKEFSMDADGTRHIKSTEIIWHEGKDFTKKRKSDDDADQGLIRWFSDTSTDDNSWELGKTIRDDLYGDAWMHFNLDYEEEDDLDPEEEIDLDDYPDDSDDGTNPPTEKFRLNEFHTYLHSFDVP
ncbi:4496_t:CDS:2 [Acaulospora colombiana]|uniref:4496_t:CDS:1 n=1 Tax=Acaulospora colombiana TaxID=27376 RepID=A0ACA9L6S2_9GLOM|nr:4496_t:CDS:2 [Acaulospora colombiana]